MNDRAVIGFFDESDAGGGTVRYLIDLIGGLDRSKFEPVFFAPVRYAWHRELEQMAVRVVSGSPSAFVIQGTPAGPHVDPPSSPHDSKQRIKLPPLAAWWAGQIREALVLRQLFRQCPVDLLQINIGGTTIAPVAARLARVPRILGTLHMMPSRDFGDNRANYRFRLLETSTCSSVHRAVAVSNTVSDRWQSYYRSSRGKIETIHNGIDVGRFTVRASRGELRHQLGLPSGRQLIGSVGSLFRIKGHATLIEAMPRILKQCSNAFVVIAGDGPLREELTRIGSHFGLMNSIKFLGHCVDTSMVYGALDLYVHPSLIEACPLAILEASAAGLPTVASEVGGIPELVVHGETGTLVPPGDPETLAHAVIDVLSSPDSGKLMGFKARNRACQEFTLQQMVDKTIAVYERMLADRIANSAPPAARSANA